MTVSLMVKVREAPIARLPLFRLRAKPVTAGAKVSTRSVPV